MRERPDIFISYSHLDTQWVQKNLYEPLVRRRRGLDKQRPNVFLDANRDGGLAPGRNWREQLTRAVSHCRRFLAVCSPPYLESKDCMWEFDLAFERDLREGEGILVPLMLEKCKLPDHAWRIQYISVRDHPDWFERLCDGLELTSAPERLTLQFVTQPSDVRVNETLAAVRLQVCSENGEIHPIEDVITVRAERNALQGETSKPAQAGIVEFDDLALDKKASKQRLVASAEGIPAVFSETVRVRQPAPSPPASADDRLPDTGQPVFFARDSALAVLGDRVVAAYSVAGRSSLWAERLPLNGRLRLIVQGRNSLVLADWEGYVYLLYPDGAPQTWRLHGEGRSLNIVGAAAHDGEAVYIGLWSGEVFRFAGKNPPELYVHHAAGVQALAVAGQRLAVAGLDGKLTLYDQGRPAKSDPLEHIVRHIKPFGRHLAVVGRTRLYQVPWDTGPVLTEELVVGEVAAVYGDSRLPIAINRQGHGILINGELATCGEFRTTPGAVPVSADDAGTWCVFRNPDGVHTLLSKRPDSRQGKIVRSWSQAIAINAGGNLLAVAEPEGVRLHKPAEFCGDNPA